MENEVTTSVKFIRMQTGEDLIAEVAEFKSGDEWYYTFYRPLKIVYTMSEKPGVLSVAMMEWIFSKIVDHQEYPIYPSDIITMVEPSEEFEEYYWECLSNLENIRELHNSNIEFFSRRREAISQYETDEEPDFDMERVKQIIDALKNGSANTSPINKKRLH